jgi:hypothetical protein
MRFIPFFGTSGYDFNVPMAVRPVRFDGDDVYSIGYLFFSQLRFHSPAERLCLFDLGHPLGSIKQGNRLYPPYVVHSDSIRFPKPQGQGSMVP